MSVAVNPGFGGPAVSGAGNLTAFRQKLALTPASCKIVLNGDSTTDYTTSSSAVTDYLKNMATQPGEPLRGMLATNIVALGYNGSTLAAWLADPTKLAALVAEAPDLVVPSWLINDVRLGQCTVAQGRARLIQYIEAVRAALPAVEFLLRIPNPFLTTNAGGLNYVQDAGGAINPAGLAQTYSDLIRGVYLSLVGVYSFAQVWDAPAEVFGTICRATHRLMADQLHPGPRESTVNSVPLNGGYVEIGKGLARRIGNGDIGFVLGTNQYASIKAGYFCFAAGSGYFDITAPDYSVVPAANYPLTTSDVVFVQGFDTPISLAGSTIFRPFGANNIRVSKAGDWTAMVGRKLAFAGAHPDATTGDRQIVAVDLPNIAAGTTATQTVAVTGARTGALHDANAVLCTPPASFVTAGLLLLGCYPTANDAATIVVLNPTGSAVDLASANFAFWVVR